MKTLIRYAFVVLLLGMMFVTTSTSPVYACSYGGQPPTTLKTLIRNSDFVVQAHVVELDDAQQNVILQVDSYLAGGSGPEYLLLMRNDPIYTRYILAGRSSGGDCLGLAAYIYPSQALYLFLDRQDDGSYRAIDESYHIFPTPDATVEVYLHENMEYGKGSKVTEPEFVKLIAQESGTNPNQPTHGTPYPLKAPLHVITNSGEQYVLPVDGNPPFELTEEVLTTQTKRYPLQSYGFDEAGSCEPIGCKTISPDGLNIAVQTDENTITLAEGKEIVGQASLFSTTSDMIAVWNKCQLTIYTIGYPRLLETRYGVKELQHTDLNGQKDCAAFSKLATWSSNGRSLAYSDEKGLWLWDTFDSSNQPSLLVAASAQVVPVARRFSPLDSYLAVIDGSKRYTLDLASGQIFPDGIFSPDDRLLLKFDTSADVSELEVCALVPYKCQPINCMYFGIFNSQGELIKYYDNLDQISKVEWTSKNAFVVRICAPEDQSVCAIFRWYPGYNGWDRYLLGRGTAFSYDKTNDVLAILQDVHTVVIDNQIYDLSGVTDSEIVNIEWLPSLFYRN